MTYWVHVEAAEAPSWHEAVEYQPPAPPPVPGRGYALYCVEIDGGLLWFASLDEMQVCLETLRQRLLPSNLRLTQKRGTGYGPSNHWLNRLPLRSFTWTYRQKVVKYLAAAQAGCVEGRKDFTLNISTKEMHGHGRKPPASLDFKTKEAEMAKDIIVNVDHRETRIAVLDDNLLVELHVEREQRVVGNLYKARVDNVLPGMEAAFVEIGLERNAFLFKDDILPEEDDEGGRRRERRDLRIQDLVKRNDQLLVQVVKGPRGTKGSRVSSRVSLPGRFLVLMPDANNLGVSRKIDEGKERDRLKKVVQSFREQGFGVIVRTESEGRSAAELRQDYLMLVETWRAIQEKAKVTPAPALIHQDMGLVYKILRDAFGSDIRRLVIDSPSDFRRAHEIIARLSPDLQDRIELYDGAKPIFEQFKIEDDIERYLQRKVPLKSGGSLIIDQTEALVSIDVNSGKFTGSTNLSDTILKTNLEATEEIARQLRLRDLGGMIILDFIDMENARDKKAVMDAFVKALKDDRSRTKISSISALGLIEMTRKRTGETVDTQMTEVCPYCMGLGRVQSAETVSLEVERELRRLAATTNAEAFIVGVHPQVGAYLIGPQGEDIEDLERELHVSITVRAVPGWHHVEKFEVDPGPAQKIEQSFPVPRRGQVVECMVTRDDGHGERAPWAVSHLLPHRGYQVDLVNGAQFAGQTVRVQLLDVRRSIGIGEVMTGGGSKNGKG